MSKSSLIENKIFQKIIESGWKEFSPIQKKSLPVIVRQRNALLVAPTGSGKTEAAVIPIFTLLSKIKSPHMGVRMLYITPLRALNRDIFRRIILYASEYGLAAQIRHSDTPTTQRQKMVSRPPEILITTPETLAILLVSRRMKNHLKTIEWIVIDELNELIGSERGAHLSLSLERVEAITNKKMTRIGLSATIGNLDEAAKFLAGSIEKCAILVDSSIRKYDIKCRYVVGSLFEVAHRIIEWGVAHTDSGRTILLFTNTRDEAEYLGALLRKEAPDFPVEVHHGSLSREIREETEANLRMGKAGLVISTSSLELGLDIGLVDLVTQLGSSRQVVKLIQRVGRSKHRFGEEAKGLVITNRLDDELESLALIRQIQQGRLEKSIIHRGALDVLAHHLVGLVIERGIYRVDDILTLVQKALPFTQISFNDIDSCLRLLERQSIIGYDGSAVKRRGPKTYQYYFENISTIPDLQQFDVIDIVHKKNVGRLDQMFIGEYGEAGRTFVLKGSSWRIVSIDDDSKVVHVEPVPTDIPHVPYWLGELIPVDFHTAQEVGRLRRIVLCGEAEASSQQRERLLKTQDMLGIIPDEQVIIIEGKKESNAFVVHACFGTKVNQTLATLLSTLISSKTGYLVEAKSDTYRILLSSQAILTAKLVVEALSADIDLENILSVAVIGTHPLNWKTWYVAKKFGVVSKKAQYDRGASRLIQVRYGQTPLYKEVLRELFLEKYDIEKTKQILLKIRSGKTKIIERTLHDFTPLAKPILDYASSFTALPISVEKSILESVKERLMNRKHRLVCLSCGRWEQVVKTMDVNDRLSCRICRSRLISETYASDLELARLVKKKKQGKMLSKEEDKKLRKAWKVSSLIQNLGKRAILVLSGFGVGPEVAARILRGYIFDEEELLRSIYRAEKLYVSTRGFWED